MNHCLPRFSIVFSGAPKTVLFLLACAASALSSAAQPPMDALLLGEQHDVQAHHQHHRETVEAISGRGELAALTLEMAEQGASTAGLPRDAEETQVRTALRWENDAWPWPAYGPAIMAAVRAGVPVLGANLLRSQMRAAMADAPLDDVLDAAALQAQRQGIREGHCGLLPESQIGPMARIQIARDRAMAQTVTGALVPGKTVLLLAGGGHVDPALGVPRHLPARLRVEAVTLPPQASGRDYCAELKQRLPKTQ